MATGTVKRTIAGGQEIKPLDRKRDEMKENLLVLHLTLLTKFKVHLTPKSFFR